MMLRVAWMCVMALALCATAQAQDEASIHGKMIAVMGGEVRSYYPVISLPWEGAAPEDMQYSVRQSGSGRDYPATLADGVFTFVPRGMQPDKEYVYQVTAEPKGEGYMPVVRIEKRPDEDVLDVFIEDQLFTSYHYSNEHKKPFLWPVNTVNGVGITRDFPMLDEDPEAEGRDHPHHKSMWSAYGDINGVDFWGEGGGSGYQRSDEVTWGSGDAYGWITAKNTWVDKDREPVIAEERTYRFYATPEKGRLIDQHTKFTAAYGDAKFGDTKEGGICSVRMHVDISGRNARITNALGDKGEMRAWGKPAAWCDYAGELGETGVVGLTIMDHPGNLRHPSSWHVRTYGLMGANCFGYSYFGEDRDNRDLLPDNGDYTVAEGESLEFNYRVYVHWGDAEEAEVADRYADYATPPKASWK